MKVSGTVLVGVVATFLFSVYSITSLLIGEQQLRQLLLSPPSHYPTVLSPNAEGRLVARQFQRHYQQQQRRLRQETLRSTPADTAATELFGRSSGGSASAAAAAAELLAEASSSTPAETLSSDSSSSTTTTSSSTQGGEDKTQQDEDSVSADVAIVYHGEEDVGERGQEDQQRRDQGHEPGTSSNRDDGSPIIADDRSASDSKKNRTETLNAEKEEATGPVATTTTSSIVTTAGAAATGDSDDAPSSPVAAADGHVGGGNKKTTTNYVLTDHDKSNSFGGCLKIMDDNHWLVEWLAYHWFALPLRHLFVYIDPHSATTPMPILERWKDRMHIEVWNRTYAPVDIKTKVGVNASGVKEHRGPQRLFLQDCMRRYKSDGWDWLALIDTDEFVSVNKYARQQFDGNEVYREKVPANDEPGSVMTFVQQEYKNPNNTYLQDWPNCFRMHRLQICLNETNVSTPVLGDQFMSTDFLTYNFKWAERGRQVKNLIRLNGISESYLHDELDLINNGTVHDPVPGQCRPLARSNWEGGPYLAREKSLLTVYHFPGTEKQRTFRRDLRGEFGTRIGTPIPWKCRKVPAEDLKPWLRGFVNTVGEQEAKRLLAGVGRVDSWPNYTSTQEVTQMER